MSLPVIFIFGPSGSGKSCAARGLADSQGFLHVDLDRNRPFERNGFPAEWDTDFGRADLAELAAEARTRAAAQARRGVAVSFPTVHIPGLDALEAASGAGVCTIVLWGTEAQCIAARQARSKEHRVKFDRGRYSQKNKSSFETYARPEYAAFRLDAFRTDGGRWTQQQMTGLILARCGAG